MSTTSTKEKAESYKQENPILDATEQTLKGWEQAIRSGLKLQEEAMQRWTEMLQQGTPSVQDWQKRCNGFAAAAKALAPETQKRMDEMLDLATKNWKAGTEILKKATDSAQASSFSERQAAWKDLWASSLGAVRSNAEALTEINNRAMGIWAEFLQKSTEAAQTRSSHAP